MRIKINKILRKLSDARELEEMGKQFIEDVEGLPNIVKKEMGII